MNALRHWLTLPERRRLLRWGGWYFLTISGLLALIGIRYTIHYPWFGDPLALAYVVMAYIGHFAFLGATMWLLVVLPLTLLMPKRKLIVPLSVAMAAAALALLLTDSLVFEEDRYHISTLSMWIFGWHTWAFLVLYFVIMLAVAGMVARWCRRKLETTRRRLHGPWVAAGLFSLVLGTHIAHMWADARYYVPITSFTWYLPLFHPARARKWLVHSGIVNLQLEHERALLEGMEGGLRSPMQYPIKPLVCTPPEKPLNVLVLLVDAMRADAMTAEVAPNITAFAQDSIVFENHYSGGNSTRMGTYSIFYGLPATYWHAIEAGHNSPVLIDAFQEHDYQLGIFTGDALYEPMSLDRTAFAKVPDLRMETVVPKGAGDAERDRTITREWMQFLDDRDPERPFFGFVFYECSPRTYPEHYDHIFLGPNGEEPERRSIEAYKTSVHFDDSLAGQVLADIEARGLLDNTVVIVSSDHGEDFDEDGLGFTGHGSAYNSSQLHTPMVVHWPGMPARTYTHRTSHNDIVATLMTRVFGCTNPPSDYCSGEDLFSEVSWDWMVSGSYTDTAIVQPDHVTVNLPNGDFEVRDDHYRLMPDPRIDSDVVGLALEETNRFFKR